MKQVKAKEVHHGRDRGDDKTGEKKINTERATKVRTPRPKANKEVSPKQESREKERNGAEETTQALEQELVLKTALYISSLSKECHVLRDKVEKQIDKHLRAVGAVPERGNTRQRQIREMSWSFLALSSNLAKLYPKRLELLPCALNGSEVYQLTHLVNAFCLTLHGGEITTQEERPLAPLVTKTEDKMQALEARKALYTFLLAQAPAEVVTHEVTRGPTLKDVYELLKEVKELLVR